MLAIYLTEFPKNKKVPISTKNPAVVLKAFSKFEDATIECSDVMRTTTLLYMK